MDLGNTEYGSQVTKARKLTECKLLRVIVKHEGSREKRSRLSFALMDWFVNESAQSGVLVEIKTPATTNAESVLQAIVEALKAKPSPSGDPPLLVLP